MIGLPVPQAADASVGTGSTAGSQAIRRAFRAAAADGRAAFVPYVVAASG